MKGLELSECYFREYGLPIIKDQFSAYYDMMPLVLWARDLIASDLMTKYHVIMTGVPDFAFGCHLQLSWKLAQNCSR